MYHETISGILFHIAMESIIYLAPESLPGSSDLPSGSGGQPSIAGIFDLAIHKVCPLIPSPI